MFEITNRISGVVLGTYPGATPMDALDAMAREFGSVDHASAMADLMILSTEDFIVVPVEEHDHA